MLYLTNCLKRIRVKCLAMTGIIPHYIILYNRIIIEMGSSVLSSESFLFLVPRDLYFRELPMNAGGVRIRGQTS